MNEITYGKTRSLIATFIESTTAKKYQKKFARVIPAFACFNFILAGKKKMMINPDHKPFYKAACYKL
jgi:hypothetical protein